MLPNAKQHSRTRTVSRFGRSWCDITCPFCGRVVRAYIWSLAGGGKRCGCGAKHLSDGTTLPAAIKALTVAIRRNRLGNWYGYIGGRRVIGFCNTPTATNEQNAVVWKREQKIKMERDHHAEQ